LCKLHEVLISHRNSIRLQRAHKKQKAAFPRPPSAKFNANCKIPNTLTVYHIVTVIVNQKAGERELRRPAISLATVGQLSVKPRGPAERTLSGETGKRREITALED
jgi:hypothetical protein